MLGVEKTAIEKENKIAAAASGGIAIGKLDSSCACNHEGVEILPKNSPSSPVLKIPQ
jgi:hypothetical protein